MKQQHHIERFLRAIVAGAHFDIVNHTEYVGTFLGKAHNHPELYQMSYVVRGGCDVLVGGRRCRVGPERVLWIPPNTFHQSCRPDERERFELAQTKFFVPFRPVFRFPAMMVVQAPHEWLTLFQQMLNEYHSQRFYRATALRLLFAQLVLLMAGDLAGPARRRTRSSRSDAAVSLRRAKINQAIAYLHKNYRAPVCLKEIAAHVGMSVSALSHEFRLVTGLAPISYLINYRLSQALALLGDPRLKISSVAEAVGFESPYYFCRQFKKRYHSAPRAYFRKIHCAR